ncbi:ABC transporter [Bifidobacterium pseudolongum subsp. globosum]|uniref:ABC transporter n=1 Tax=Bifidobacterium pseudolongum subsp. globosum TaxID=1690 RepID=A0A4Q5A0Z7_9BIFI|nr:ATP-binding cassette domain-containing protein [Bifidobacterium pseudolongum]RYQ10983.1 ABC transporter [Bifidobacterium pseudolongum subsp. globosum]
MSGITVSSLGYSIRGHQILHNVNLACHSGTVTALRGRSGCGKTTLLDLLGMLLIPTTGSIGVNGMATEHWKDGQRCRFWHDHAAFVFQDYGMIPHENVLYNITLNRREARHAAKHLPRKMAAILSYLRLEDRYLEPIDALSGGERQRVSVARALWKDADYVFADEPTASLDAENKRIVTNLLFDLAAKGVCVVIATHDDDLVAKSHQSIDVERFSPTR